MPAHACPFHSACVSPGRRRRRSAGTSFRERRRRLTIAPAFVAALLCLAAFGAPAAGAHSRIAATPSVVLSPTHGSGVTTITVTPVAPCPPPAGAPDPIVFVQFEFGGGGVGAEAPVTANGLWLATITTPSDGGPQPTNLPPGQRIVQVECLADGNANFAAPNIYFTYADASFTVDGPALGARPIIFIPGITGTYLTNGSGTETWPAVQGLADCLQGTHSVSQCGQKVVGDNALASNGTTMHGNPALNVDAANGVQRPLVGTIGGAIDSTHAVRYFQHADAHHYDVTAENFQRSGYHLVQPSDDAGLRACAATLKCFIPMGVDWRKSAVYNAQRILSLIDHVRVLTDTDRVNVVAHSQGGLITNALVHMPGSVGKIYRIVTFGTPWLGAPKLLGALLYGEPCLADLALGGCALDQGVVQRLIANYPGAAELNPSPAYYAATTFSPLLHVANKGPVSMSFDQAHQIVKQKLAAAPLRRDTSLIDAAASFHNAVDRWAPLDPSVQLLRMIGYDASESANPCSAAPCSIAGSGSYTKGTGTIAGIDVDNGDLYYATGDGTVPLNSANVYDPAKRFDDRNGAHDLYFCGVSHQGLAQSEVVWEFAAPFLGGSATYTHDDVKLGCPDSTDGTLQGVHLDASAGAAIARAASRPSVAQGSVFDVSVAGVSPGATVTVTVQPSSTILGTLTADTKGNVSAVVGLPMSVPRGVDALMADAVAPTGTHTRLTSSLMVTAHRSGLATTSAISGTVSARSTFAPLRRVCVRAFSARSFSRAGRAATDRSGKYRLGGLKPGAYKVEFGGCRPVRYQPMWYRSSRTSRGATVIRLARGGEKAQVDASLTARR